LDGWEKDNKVDTPQLRVKFSISHKMNLTVDGIIIAYRLYYLLGLINANIFFKEGGADCSTLPLPYFPRM
jgi:hypothetical protein